MSIIKINGRVMDYSDWHMDDSLGLDELDSSHETLVRICARDDWYRVVNEFIDRAIDNDRDINYIEDVGSEENDGYSEGLAPSEVTVGYDDTFEPVTERFDSLTYK